MQNSMKRNDIKCLRNRKSSAYLASESIYWGLIAINEWEFMQK